MLTLPTELVVRDPNGRVALTTYNPTINFGGMQQALQSGTATEASRNMVRVCTSKRHSQGKRNFFEPSDRPLNSAGLNLKTKFIGKRTLFENTDSDNCNPFPPVYKLALMAKGGAAAMTENASISVFLTGQTRPALVMEQRST